MRIALRRNKRHPELDLLTLNLLWSINERLGGGRGADIGPVGLGWLDDLIALEMEDAPSIDDELEDLD